MLPFAHGCSFNYLQQATQNKRGYLSLWLLLFLFSGITLAFLRSLETLSSPVNGFSEASPENLLGMRRNSLDPSFVTIIMDMAFTILASLASSFVHQFSGNRSKIVSKTISHSLHFQSSIASETEGSIPVFFVFNLFLTNYSPSIIASCIPGTIPQALIPCWEP